MSEPVVIQFETPRQPPSWRDKLPKLSPKGSRILIAVGSAVVIVSMVTFTIFGVLSTNKDFSKQHGLDINDSQAQDDSALSQAALPGGNIAKGVGGTTGTNAPVVTLTATPASVVKGGKSKLKWSVTNKPKQCVASDDWSGDKPAKGEVNTQVLTTVQTYLFTLTCKTDTGTGFATVSIGAIDQGGTGDSAKRPEVTLAANPSKVYTNGSSALVWRTTQSPTSCTASGDWNGVKSTSGQASTGTLTKVKTYTYTLTCKNAAGTGFATATVKVEPPPPNVPIVSIKSNPAGPIAPGGSLTLSWSTTNNPSSCTASGDWSGSKSANGSQKISNLSSIKTYDFSLTCKNAAGGTFDSAAVAVIPNVPNVSIAASPSSLYKGSSSTLSWSTTNSPTKCTAGGDWSGLKSSSGSQSTGALNSVQTYTYTLQCENQGGKGSTKTTTVVVSLPPAPTVSLGASPITTTVGGSANLSWSTSNTPTSCSASGDWSGAKSTSGGTQSTGTLNTAKTYSYSLNCVNAGGSRSASTSVSVNSGGPTGPPAVSLSASPSPIGTGDAATLTWGATNSPTSCTASGNWSGSKSASGSLSTGTMNTAGSYSYTLTCSNGVGSNSATANLTVIAKPSITLSVSPSTINTGSSSTITWSVANSPTSCTAGGGWSGSKASNGSQSTGTMNTAGSYSFNLSCSNAGGTSTKSVTLTVNNAAPVYCGGLTPCYGPSDLAAHGSPGNCWSWNLTWVVNITSFRPSHPGGIKSGSTSTIESASGTCNHNMNSILAGSAAISGYRDSGGATTHNHKTATKSNSGSSQLLSFRVGYYDASKP